MRSVIAISALAVLLACSATALKTSTFDPKKHVFSKGKNTGMGKTVEMMPGKGMFQSKYGKGHNQAANGNIWPVSIYWTYVEIGTPAKKFAAAIDSGSQALYVTGKNCNGCISSAPNIPYDPSQSSTSQGPIGPGFSEQYETCNPVHPTQVCSISGNSYYDQAGFSGFEPVKVLLGAITQQTSNFYQFQTIDGVVGMIGGTPNTVFYQQCTIGGKCEDVWAICMVEGSKSNGTLTIGGVDPEMSTGPIQYVPSTNATFFHQIVVHNLNIGGTTYDFGAFTNQAILDTGTNDILLYDSDYDKVQKIMCGDSTRKHCDSFFNNASFCTAMSQADMDAYPSIDFSLQNNVTLTITPKDYFLKNSPAASSPDQYCFGISKGGSALFGGNFIIGDTLMQNYYLVFAEQHVGWGPVNRTRCGSV